MLRRGGSPRTMLKMWVEKLIPIKCNSPKFKLEDKHESFFGTSRNLFSEVSIPNVFVVSQAMMPCNIIKLLFLLSTIVKMAPWNSTAKRHYSILFFLKCLRSYLTYSFHMHWQKHIRLLILPGKAERSTLMMFSHRHMFLWMLSMTTWARKLYEICISKNSIIY